LLQRVIDTFVSAPTEPAHKAAKDAWITARVAYGRSEASRFYEGPIGNAETGPVFARAERTGGLADHS
jgi:putative iron-regulated protein